MKTICNELGFRSQTGSILFFIAIFCAFASTAFAQAADQDAIDLSAKMDTIERESLMPRYSPDANLNVGLQNADQWEDFEISTYTGGNDDNGFLRFGGKLIFDSINNPVMGDAPILYGDFDGDGIGDVINSNFNYLKLNDVSHCDVGLQTAGKDNSVIVDNNFHNSSHGMQCLDEATTSLSGYANGGGRVAGINRIHDNSEAQISINDNAQPNLGVPAGHTDPTEWTQWAQNDVENGGQGNAKLLKYLGGEQVPPDNNQFVLNSPVTGNFWNYALRTGDAVSSGENQVFDMTYANGGSTSAPNGDYQCEEVTTKIISKGNGVLSNNNCDDYASTFPDTAYLYWKADCLEGYGNDSLQQAQDLFKKYCELHPYATGPGGYTVNALGQTGACAIGLEHLSHPFNFTPCYIEYNWAIKMQPLSSEPSYQSEIWHLLADMMDNTGHHNEAANLWWNYMQHYNLPHWEDSSVWGYIQSIRRYQAEIPQDTTPFYLLTFPLQPIPIDAVGDGKMEELAVSLSPNPAKEEVRITFYLPKTTQFIIAIYDELGREKLQTSSGWLQAGKQDFPIDIRTLPTGSYYLRLQYTDGVKTVKLVHEK